MNTGYGTLWPDHPLDLPYYRKLAADTGFRVAAAKEQPGAFHTFFMELRKP